MDNTILLCPVYGPGVRLVGYSAEDDEKFLEFIRSRPGSESYRYTGHDSTLISRACDPTDRLYCLPQWLEKQLNDFLSKGYVLVGYTLGSYIVVPAQSLQPTDVVEIRVIGLDKELMKEVNPPIPF